MEPSDSHQCPYIQGCPVYKHFRLEASLKVLKMLYCHGQFEHCQRKQLRDRGEKVPEKLLPDGQYLE